MKGVIVMFRYNVRGENIEVTEAIRDYVEKKVGKLERYFSDSPEATVHVNLKVYTEETSPDLYASIDLVVDKLERQIRKFKTKINRKSRETGRNNTKAAVFLVGEETEETPSELDIVRTKRLSLKPMDSEEAVLQMNMLGHNFFIFEDAETNGTSIVYRRKDGKYGLIETD